MINRLFNYFKGYTVLNELDVTETKSSLDIEIYKKLEKIIIPETCDRCLYNKPIIRVFDNDTYIIEFICYSCKT